MNYINSDIHHIGIRKALLFAYQRAVRGYDDRISRGWGFVEYLDVLLEPLKELCEEEIDEFNIVSIVCVPPVRRKNVFLKTVKLIDEYRAIENLNSFEYDKKEKELWTFIGEHSGMYWN